MAIPQIDWPMNPKGGGRLSSSMLEVIVAESGIVLVPTSPVTVVVMKTAVTVTVTGVQSQAAFGWVYALSADTEEETPKDGFMAMA